MRSAARLILCLLLAACSGSGGQGSAPTPDEGVTVRVTNRSGGPATVSYSFARTPPGHLGNVGRLGEAEFVFAWEPGPLEFVVDVQGGVLTSNRLSTRPGETVYLEITGLQARATKEGGGT